ncbi:MAG: MBL fold metallo-hydrolase [Promethearchaeota archaeon]
MKLFKEILPNLFYFEEGEMLDCNMYIIRDDQGNWILFDTGNGLSMPSFVESLSSLDLKLENLQKIYVTHDHLDHVMGIYKLRVILNGNLPPIYAHPYCSEMLREGKETRIVPPLFGLNAMKFGINVVPLENVIDLENQAIVSFGNYSFKVIYSPGHSKGSVCYFETEKHLLFSGDVVFPQGSFGRYDFPGCSLQDLTNSISQLIKLNIDILCAGHMPPVIQSASQGIKQSYQNIRMMS